MRMSGKRITFTSSKIDSCWNHLKRLKHVSHHRCSLVFCAIKTIMVKYHAPFGVIYDKLGFWIQWHSGAEVRFVSPVTASGSVKFSPEGYILPEDNILSRISTEVLSSLIYLCFFSSLKTVEILLSLIYNKNKSILQGGRHHVKT